MRKHRAFLILIALAATLFLSDIWTYKEFVRAESYFALGARLMVERNEWLAPHAPDESQLNKPPLTFWLIGISYKVFDADYGSARLPSVLAALGVLVIVYALGTRFHGERAGLISAGILGCSYLFLTFARTAMSDMLLTLFVTASVTCFILTLTNLTNRLALLAYVSLALAILTKGPVAILMVGLPVVLAVLWSRDLSAARRLRLGIGTVLFLVIAAPYFVVLYLHFGIEPLRFFFLSENLQRFTGALYGSSGRPFWYEVPAFFSDFAPWSPLIFIALWVDWRTMSGDTTTRLTRRLLYLWLLTTIGLFSLSSFKLDYYLLPAMPAAALIIGPALAKENLVTGGKRVVLKAFLILVSLALLIGAGLYLRAAAVLSVTGVVRFAPLLVTAAGLVIVSFAARRKSVAYTTGVVGTTIWVTILTAQLALLPAFTRYFVAPQLADGAPADRPWLTSRAASDWANCLAFNLAPPHEVKRFIGDANNDGLLTELQNNSRALAIVREREFADLVKRDSTLQVLAQAETYGHGGLTLRLLRNPSRDRLLLIGHAR